MKIAVINSSYPTYNLATHKMLWQFTLRGDEVYYSPRADMWSQQCQKAYLSAIFTYDLPALCQDANNLKAAGVELEIGGPAATAMPAYIKEKTGISPHIGLDERWEHTEGPFLATFTSRGCPRACEFCIVKLVEGRKMTEYENFNVPVGVNPYVCDNNLLATSWGHQQLVVEKLKPVRNLDINSGFDDRIFLKNPEKYWRLYSQLDLEAWRFAYDLPEQREAIKACADFLHGKGVDYRRIIVFCIAGFGGTTFEECRARLQYLVDVGVSPYPMRYRPITEIEQNTIPSGWYKGQMDMLFGYYGVPFVWRSCTWDEYCQNEKSATWRRQIEQHKNAKAASSRNLLKRLTRQVQQS